MRFPTRSASDDGPREQPSEEIHDAVLCHAWSVGLQAGYGATDEPKHKVCLVFELAEKDSKGRPFQVFKEETFSLFGGKSDGSGNKANLRKILDTLRPGKDNSPEAVNEEGGTAVFSGLPCRVEIEHRNSKAKIVRVSKPSAAGLAMKPVFTYEDARPIGLAKWMMESQLTEEQAAAIRARIRAAKAPAPTAGPAAADDPAGFP